MRNSLTKRSRARIAPLLSFGLPESSNFTPPRVSPTNPSAALRAEPSESAASASLLCVANVLRDVLIREDVSEKRFLRDEVRDGIDRMCRTLEYLADRQKLFELSEFLFPTR